jgi:hypothetical protein
MANPAMATRVVVHVGSPESVAANMPKMAVVVSVPRLAGWMSGSLEDVSKRIRTAVANVVSSRDERKAEMAADLRRAINTAVETRQDVQEAVKTWCVSHPSVPAVQALCDNPHVVMDSSLASFAIDTADRAGSADRSMGYAALAARVLSSQQVQDSTDAASRLLAASLNLPWQAPAHAEFAKAMVRLETDLGLTSVDKRSAIDEALGASVSQWVDHYTEHQRIAVVVEVAAVCMRPEVLERIGRRAQEAHAVDPRLTYSLVNALIDNKSVDADVLRPFVGASMWTQAEGMALASRTGYAIAQRKHAAAPTPMEP